MEVEGPGRAAGDGEGSRVGADVPQAQREWFEKDYYKVLGVPDTASDKEIQRAYRKLAKKFHPDANPGDKPAEERFKEVSAANDVLGDATKRKEYDEVRKLGPSAFNTGNGGGGGFGFSSDDLRDLIGNLFGPNRKRGGARSGPLGGGARPPPGGRPRT